MYRFREMIEMDGGGSSSTSKPPQQISDMFSKFATAFKTKTYELFADEEDVESESDGADVALLLDSAEEFIPDLKVVVVKPDSNRSSISKLNPNLVHSLFATLSSFEASYLQFQAAHVPEIDENALESADKSLVSILMKLTEMRNWYRECRRKGSVVADCDFEFPAGSFLEFRVQENQSKLRVLETMVNSLQSQIESKHDEVRGLRRQLDKVRVCNAGLSRRLGLKEGQGIEVLLTVRVFDAMLGDSVRLVRNFTKLLVDLMRRAGWELEEAASSVYSGVDYAKKGHFRYAFMSYVCLRMFQSFDKNDFGLCDGEVLCNGGGSLHSENGVVDGEVNGYLRQLIEHVASSPMEILSKNPKSEFSRFCERKYDGLIHPTMESSIFSSLDKKEKVLKSWKSLTVFYDSYVRMASSIWLLHKLAYSFNPVVEIFQVERAVEFSMVYMEDVLGKVSMLGKTRPRVGFTVVPGFKVGRTIIQAQVYLTGLNQAE